MDTLVIIGKNKSIDTFPTNFHHMYQSIGLNHATYLFDTTIAMTGHDSVLLDYKQNNVPDSKIVCLYPTFEDSYYNHYKDTIKYYDRFKCKQTPFEYCLEEIRYLVYSAKYNLDITYPTFNSILHIAIFYALKKQFDNILLCGCNLDVNTINGYNQTIDWIYAQSSLDKMILCAKEVGVKITQISDYSHFLKFKKEIWYLD